MLDVDAGGWSGLLLVFLTFTMLTRQPTLKVFLLFHQLSLNIGCHNNNTF